MAIPEIPCSSDRTQAILILHLLFQYFLARNGSVKGTEFIQEGTEANPILIIMSWPGISPTLWNHGISLEQKFLSACMISVFNQRLVIVCECEYYCIWIRAYTEVGFGVGGSIFLSNVLWFLFVDFFFLMYCFLSCCISIKEWVKIACHFTINV